MRDPRLTFETDLTGLDERTWLRRIDALVEEHGSFFPLGPSHAAAFLDAGRTLLVTFEAIPEILSRADALPVGFDFARTEGWSVLAMLNTGESWFRDTRVYGYIDRLIDDGFFEDFDRVLFYGCGAGGFAASAFSVAAPGARVLALQPQATLDPDIAGWDTRHFRFRGADFTTRYGYAPDMIDAVDRAYIVYCPQQPLDAMHAALFARHETATLLRADGLDDRLGKSLEGLGILSGTIRAAMDGTLCPARFARIIAVRKRSTPYLRGLVLRLIDRRHDRLAAAVCRIALKGGANPFFERHLATIGDTPGIVLTQDAG